MKNRTTVRVLVAALAAFALSGVLLSAAAAKGEKTAARIVEGIPVPEVGTLDPDIQGSQGGYVDQNSLELIMKLDPQGHVLPNLAQSVTQPGKAVYVYHLRHGVKFWDGKELTAEDVANSINYARYPTSGTKLILNVIKSAVAKDKYTFVVTLKHTDASFPYVFTYTGFIFEKAFQQANPSQFGKPGRGIMGTGPYKITSLDPTQGVELDANPNYWGGKPSIQHISIKFFNGEQPIALAFRAGQVDLAFPADGRGFSTTANTKLVAVPSAQQGFFAMDTKYKCFADVHVRRAVQYAIDRAGIVRSIGGYAVPDYTMIPPVQLYSIASKAQVDKMIAALPPYTFDLAKAKAELAKASPACSNGFSFDSHTFAYGKFVETSEAIAGMLAKIGITMNVKVDSVGDYVNLFYNAPGFTNIYTYFYSQSPDPGYLPHFIYDSKQPHLGGDNFGEISIPAVDTLLQQGVSTTDPAKRFAIYSKILKIMQPVAAYVPLYEGNNLLALDSKFSFPTFNAYTSDHTEAWALDIKVK
jgi:peptide/nickel transport system substrate-binding protein